MRAPTPQAAGHAPWLQRPGLAGGIDQDGSRAAELLACGFGSVEFGSVTAQPLPGQNAGVAALVQALAAALAAVPQGTALRAQPCAVGIGLAVPPTVALAQVAVQWMAGYEAAAKVADYASLNLSARAHQRLLEPAGLAVLGAAFSAVAWLRQQQGHSARLAVKLPGSHPAAPMVAALAMAAGFDQLTVVLPGGSERWACLSALRQQIGPAPDLVAVGGIRCSADVAQALACGASGVQVHGLFAAYGAQCLQRLALPASNASSTGS